MNDRLINSGMFVADTWYHTESGDRVMVSSSIKYTVTCGVYVLFWPTLLHMFLWCGCKKLINMLNARANNHTF
jgi:hypothetical protein